MLASLSGIEKSFLRRGMFHRQKLVFGVSENVAAPSERGVLGATQRHVKKPSSSGASHQDVSDGSVTADGLVRCRRVCVSLSVSGSSLDLT